MDDAEDYDSWSAVASVHPELAAHQIVRLRNPGWNLPWRDLVPAETALSLVSVEWGSRRKRSGTGAGPARIRARCQKDLAASPATPMDFGSGSGSASGSEEASSSMEKTPAMEAEERKRRTADYDVSGGCVSKVGGIYLEPSGFRISAASAAKDIRRPGKKKTMCELQEEEKLLLEHKIILLKEVELGMLAYKALQAENKRLKSQQSSLQSEMVRPIASMLSSRPASSSRFILPDLNEPLSNNLD